MMHGSFQVFRRLSQDVPGWWAQIIRAQQLLPANDPLSADALAAKTVGRWRSGTPLAQAPDRDNRSVRERTEDNNFKFNDDPEGLKTPIFAHIRKMYPRNPGLGDRQRRIIRRGIPFGDPFDPTNGRGHGVDADRGLIFNVFMASIEGQFEFLQQTWANNPDFQSQNDGPDPVIGESSKPVTLHREGRPDAILDFRRFVHTSGAVYAFAPSISTLLKLGNGELGQDNDPDAIHVGDTVFIRADQDVNWRIRSTPSLSGRVMTVIGPRTTLTVTDGPAEQDGHTWWKVRTANNREGWITALALVKTL
jgi:Dyp-type peroxidase family